MKKYLFFMSLCFWMSLVSAQTFTCDLAGSVVDPANGGASWNRPFEDGSGMSSVGTGVGYHVYGPFTVDTAGSYEVASTQTGWDGFIFIYQNAFDPTTPLVNYLAGSDDDTGVGNSRITTNLAVGTNYYLITTGFDPTEFGAFTNTITGAGTVSCDGSGGPGGEDCSVTYDGTLQDGLGNMQALLLANDFTVDAGVTMEVDQLTLNIFGNITTANVAIYQDASGMPGTLVNSFSGVTPTSQTLIGSAFGFNVYEVVLDMTPVSLEGGASGSKFWVSLGTTAGSENVANYWEAADATTNAISFISSDGGTTWAANTFGQDGAFVISGMCEGESGPGGEACNDTYDGTLQDGLGNMQALLLANDFTVDADVTMEVDQLTLNIFGNITTANVAIYEDASGMPGTLVNSFSGVTPTSQTLIGSAFGFNVYEVVLDMATPVSLEGGASGSKFWVSLGTTAGSENVANYWEAADATTNALSFISSDGGTTWAANTFGQDGAFVISGMCEGGNSEPNEYCIPVLDCTDNDLISNVTFAGIDNDSTCSPDGYGDYTSMMANVQAGQSYPISVTVGSGWAFESVSVWIDYDNSGTFDQNEFTYVGTGSASDVTGEIEIPSDVANGQYRMRVRVAAVGETTATWDMACDESQGFGETEDYTLNVGAGGGTDCEQEFTGEATGGSGSSSPFMSANDFDVAANTQFTLETVSVDVVPLSGTVTTFDVYIYDDSNGPGTQVASHMSITPTSVTPNGMLFDLYPIYTVEIDLPTAAVLSGGSAGAKYWAAVVMGPSTTAQQVFWIFSPYNSASGSEPLYQSPNDGGSWAPYADQTTGENAEGVMTVSGTCGDLGVSDMTAYDFAYYPNPVKDELNITSQKLVQSVSVYNMAGQQVSSQKLNVNNGKVSTSSLAPGVYVFRAVLDGGQVETFKVIKK